MVRFPAACIPGTRSLARPAVATAHTAVLYTPPVNDLRTWGLHTFYLPSWPLLWHSQERPLNASEAAPGFPSRASPQLKAAGPLRGAALGLLPSGSVPVLRTSFVGFLPRCAHKRVSLAQRVALCGWHTCRARCYCGHAALQSCWPRSPTPHRAASPEDVAGRRRGLMLHRGVVACHEDPTPGPDTGT